MVRVHHLVQSFEFGPALLHIFVVTGPKHIPPLLFGTLLVVEILVNKLLPHLYKPALEALVAANSSPAIGAQGFGLV